MAKIFLFIGYIRLTQSRKTKTLFVMQEYLCLHIHGGERTAKSQYFKKNIHNSESYHTTKMQRDIVIQKLKEQGCRITKQRLMLLDIILEEACSCCKEIYYKASRVDKKIGLATVYRMIKTLEEIGAISRKNMYKIACGSSCEKENICTIEFVDDTVLELSGEKWNQIIRTGLSACGYMNGKNIRSVAVRSCECGE